MDCILAPGRMKYLKSEVREGCIFCSSSIREDEFVLYEGIYSFVMMNKYPYTTGHLLVVPNRHIRDIEEMTEAEQMEVMGLTAKSIGILKKALKPEGFNIGMNIGKAAGAGVDSHLHLHIVPRWLGDTNFSTVLGEVRVIPEEVTKTRDALLPWFQKKEE